MFNIQGSELIFLLLVALVVLGPEKLPEAVRKFTKAYSEFKKMANGFQGEFRQVLDEPMRELRETANLVRDAAKFDLDTDLDPDGKGTPTATPTTPTPSKAQVDKAQIDKAMAVSEIAPKPAQAARREAGLNFGSANPRRQTRIARDDSAAVSQSATPAAGSPVPDQTTAGADTPAPAEVALPADTPPPSAAPTAEDASE